MTGGNRNDVTQLLPLIHAVPPIRGKRGRPRQRPDVLYADRGYDHNIYRRQVRELGHPPAHRPARHRARKRPGQEPLVRRSGLRTSALVSPAAYPLGNPRRHPPGLPHPRLRNHLLAAPQKAVLI
ncbi:transposase [Streptomyces sp. NBC_01589]|uniref:transposase n=1 Tax=Streptomyces sp. NBC_01589 TaxID=2975886 RepID=UPI00386D7B6D